LKARFASVGTFGPSTPPSLDKLIEKLGEK
jgi:hypothetical protein